MRLLTQLKNKWYLLSWELPFWRKKRWREHLAWREADGSNDETFPIENVQMPGMVLYVHPAAIFSKGTGQFVDTSYEAGARRSVTRSLKLIRDREGFIAVPHGEWVYEARTVADNEMPHNYLPVTNGNQV